MIKWSKRRVCASLRIAWVGDNRFKWLYIYICVCVFSVSRMIVSPMRWKLLAKHLYWSPVKLKHWAEEKNTHEQQHTFCEWHHVRSNWNGERAVIGIRERVTKTHAISDACAQYQLDQITLHIYSIYKNKISQIDYMTC